MKLSELNPGWALASAVPDGAMLLFDCPLCGKGYQVAVLVHNAAPKHPIWKWNGPTPEAAQAAGKPPDWNSITLEPSIRNHSHGRKPCGWHGSIENGEIK